MSKLLMVVKRLIQEHEDDGEPATIRLYRGLAIGYREVDGIAALSLSRIGQEPSKQEVAIILAVIEKIERLHSEPIVDGLFEITLSDSTRKHHVIRIHWEWLE